MLLKEKQTKTKVNLLENFCTPWYLPKGAVPGMAALAHYNMQVCLQLTPDSPWVFHEYRINQLNR